MKRNNPETNKPFKRGDVREDGFVFFNYTNQIKSTGFFMERWLSPEASAQAKTKDKTAKKAKYQRKTDRRSPGHHQLTAAQKATVNRLQELNKEWVQYGDMTLEMVAEDLIGYDLGGSAELDAAIQHAGPLAFDAKEAFRLSLSL